MIIATHIVIALASILYTTYLLLSPAKANFNVSYGLVGMTLASGSFLIFLQPNHMAQACVSGLAYTAFVLVAIIVAKRRLAKVSIN